MEKWIANFPFYSSFQLENVQIPKSSGVSSFIIYCLCLTPVYFSFVKYFICAIKILSEWYVSYVNPSICTQHSLHVYLLYTIYTQYNFPRIVSQIHWRFVIIFSVCLFINSLFFHSRRKCCWWIVLLLVNDLQLNSVFLVHFRLLLLLL